LGIHEHIVSALAGLAEEVDGEVYLGVNITAILRRMQHEDLGYYVLSGWNIETIDDTFNRTVDEHYKAGDTKYSLETAQKCLLDTIGKISDELTAVYQQHYMISALYIARFYVLCPLLRSVISEHVSASSVASSEATIGALCNLGLVKE
jgi:hypothetical protein